MIKSKMLGQISNQASPYHPMTSVDSTVIMDFYHDSPHSSSNSKVAPSSFTHTPPPSPPYNPHQSSIPVMVEEVPDKTYTTLQPRIKQLPDNDMNSLSIEPDPSDMLSWERRHPYNWSSEEVMDFIFYLAGRNTPDDVIPDIQGCRFNSLTGNDLACMPVGEFLEASPEHGQLFYEKFHELCDQAMFPHCPEMSTEDDYAGCYQDFSSLDHKSPCLSSCLGMDEGIDGEVSPSATVRIQGFEYDFYLEEQFTDMSGRADDSGYISGDSTGSGCYSFSEDSEHLPSVIGNDYISPMPPRIQEHQQQQPQQQQPLKTKRGPGRPRKTLPDGQPKPTSQRGRKPGQTTKGNHLYEFIRDLLYDSKFNPSHVKWEDKEIGVFRFVQSEKVARLWGNKKNNQKMTYEKLSRAMRFCRTVGYFDSLPKDRGFPKKLCFKFGSKAQNWQHSYRSLA